MRRLQTIAVATLTAITLALSLSISEAEAESNDPHEETFKYRFKWSFIPAASAEITVRQEERDGRPVVVLTASARSSRLVDPLWKMRDTVEAIYFSDTGESLRYKLTQRENLKRIETLVEFDNEKSVAHTSWKKRKGKHEWEKEVEIPFSDAHDPLTAAMLIMRTDFENEDECEFVVVGGKRLYMIRLKKIKTERVRTRAGRFDTVKLKLSSEAIYPPPDPSKKKEKKVKSVYLWLSKEEDPKLVKMQAKAFVGSVTAQLVK